MPEGASVFPRLPMLPLLSQAVQLTVVAPTANMQPLGGTQVTLVTAQLSVVARVRKVHHCGAHGRVCELSDVVRTGNGEKFLIQNDDGEGARVAVAVNISGGDDDGVCADGERLPE